MIRCASDDALFRALTRHFDSCISARMDMNRIQAALNGELDLSNLTVVERMAVAHEVVRAELRRPQREPLPERYVLPEYIEAMFRGRSS